MAIGLYASPQRAASLTLGEAGRDQREALDNELVKYLTLFSFDFKIFTSFQEMFGRRPPCHQGSSTVIVPRVPTGHVYHFGWHACQLYKVALMIITNFMDYHSIPFLFNCLLDAHSTNTDHEMRPVLCIIMRRIRFCKPRRVASQSSRTCVSYVTLKQ